MNLRAISLPFILVFVLATNCLAQPVAPPSGQIFVSDDGRQQIVRIDDMTGAGWTTFPAAPGPGSGVDQFAGPHSHYVSAAGQIYVADTANCRVVRIDDMTGTGWITFGTCGSGVNQFNGLRGIFATDAGQIYVADSTNGRIVRIDDMTGAGWTTLGTPGPGVKQFFFPDAIFVSDAGQIYVTDQDNARIVRMDDMTGAGWTTFGAFGNSINQFRIPRGIFVSPAGQIYVADRGNNRIVRINDMTGAGWTTFGTLGSDVNQFNDPPGIFVSPAGQIYVTDRNNARIVRIDDMTGAGWTTLGTAGIGVNQFSSPRGIVFHTNLVVTKTGAPEPVTVGNALTYTITAINSGPATTLTLTDPLPAGLTFVSATPTQGSCSGPSTVTCNLGTVATGATATVTIVATPTATGVITNTATVAGTTITASATTTVVPAVTLSVVRVGTGGGTVTSSPAGISCGTTCSAGFARGTSVVLTATPDSTSTFASWSGCDTVLGAQCAVALTSAKTVTSTFQPLSTSARLTIRKAGTGSGVVTSPTGISCGGICTQAVNTGTVLTLTASPDTGSSFTGWTACSGVGTCTVTLTADTTVTATFTAPAAQFALAVALRGSASGTVTSNPSGIACGSSCAKLFASGIPVTLTASAGPGAAFKGWFGGGCSGTGACTLAMTAMRSVSAIFAAVFTDPDATAETSIIRAVGIRELRSAVNTLGAQNIGASFTFTDPTIAVGSTVVKAVHFTELRTAVGSACIQAGVPPPNYTDSTLTTGVTLIRAIDLNELRSAILALE